MDEREREREREMGKNRLEGLGISRNVRSGDRFKYSRGLTSLRVVLGEYTDRLSREERVDAWNELEVAVGRADVMDASLYRNVASRLLTQLERVIPKKRMKALKATYKRAVQLSARVSKKRASAMRRENLDASTMLPFEVTRMILGHLVSDPVSLNSCERVCTQWRDVVSELRREQELLRDNHPLPQLRGVLQKSTSVEERVARLYVKNYLSVHSDDSSSDESSSDESSEYSDDDDDDR